MPSLAQINHLLSCLKDAVFADTGHRLPLTWQQADPEKRTQMLTGPHADWEAVSPTTIWGEPQSYFWFAGSFEIPDELTGQDLWLYLDAQFGRVMGRSDPQCLIRINGNIVQGGDFNHRHVRLTEIATPGKRLDVMIEAGTIEDRRQVGFGCRILSRDALAEDLYFDLAAPLDVAQHLGEADHRRDLILNTVYEALNTVDLRPGNPERFGQSLLDAKQIANRIYETGDTEAMPVITATGHTHIDVAWLWRVRETRQKMARSMATVLTLMKDYPDYSFMYNQGYLLDTLSKDYPELFDQIRARQKECRFEIEGALWLEPDANMTGGESLIRHITKGIAYHQDTFGITPRIVWLPDTFGYSAALPQLMALANLDVFVTHKMSWNDTNKMPNEIFWWEGLDGTRAPTYFLTTQPMESTSIGTTYCPDLRPSHIMGTWRRFSQKQSYDHLWMVYGHGDGGGGPTRDMLEHLRRMERGIPGCPKIEHGPMRPFFDKLVKDMRDQPDRFPSWCGELYLEFHRGTFTSVAEVKRNNRRGEALLREIETLASLARMLGTQSYPTERISALWDTLLLNQFHDILPGSSIKEVYEDSRREFEVFFQTGNTLKQELMDGLSGSAELVVNNPFGQHRSGLARLEDTGATPSDLPHAQPAWRADGTPLQLIPVQNVPASGLLCLNRDEKTARSHTEELSVSTGHLENAHIRAEFGKDGRLVALHDKTSDRQLLAGPGNRLQVFRDLPAQFDAWDIDQTFEDQMWEVDDLVSAEVVETGPLRAAIRFCWRYERSNITQVVSLESGAGHIEFDTYVDWKEPHSLLKTAFPLTLQARESIAETQFGHVRRPTHQNTSWDQARFETPMLRWVALSDQQGGLAFLNDCKYGYDAKDSTVRLTLLRAPTWPWDGADIGEHRFRYAAAAFQSLKEVPLLAEEFNEPLRAHQTANGTSGSAERVGALELLSPGAELSTLKLAEDGQSLIARVWERNGQHQPIKLRLHDCVSKVAIVNLIEEHQQHLELDADNCISIDLSPFQIISLKLALSERS